MRRAGDRPRPFSWHGVAAVSWLLAALCGSCVSPPAEPAAEPAAKPVVEPVAEPVAAPAPPAAPAPSEPEPTGWSPDQPAEWPAEWLAEQKARKAAQAAKEGQAAPGTETPVAPAAPAVEPQIEPVVKADEEEATAPGFVHGSLSTVFRDRNTGSQRSRDLWALLDVEMGDEETDPWTATVVGRVYETFGEDDGKFSSPEATLGSNLSAQLYEAHLDLHDVPSMEVVSLGRMEQVETPVWVRYDGASLVTLPGGSGRQSYGFYGGQTVHYWESSPEGDGLFGGWWVDHPWKGGRTRVDWMHIEDESITGSQQDDLLAMQLRQNVAESTKVQGDYSWIGGTPRDRRLAATWSDAETATVVQGTWYELLSTQFDLTEELDPFSPMLFAQFPYREATAVASRSWDDDFDLDGGLDVRRVTDQSDVTDFNRDFERYHVTGTRHHVFTDGLSLGLTGELWDSGGTSQESWGLDATHEWNKLRASLGTYYALFKNDFFAGKERDDVRTWYAALRYMTASRTTWTLGYDLEDTSEGTFHTLRLGAVWRF